MPWQPCLPLLLLFQLLLVRLACCCLVSLLILLVLQCPPAPGAHTHTQACIYTLSKSRPERASQVACIKLMLPGTASAHCTHNGSTHTSQSGVSSVPGNRCNQPLDACALRWPLHHKHPQGPVHQLEACQHVQGVV